LKNNFNDNNISVNNQLRNINNINYGMNLGAAFNSRNSIDYGIEDHLAACCINNPEYEHLYSIWIIEKKRITQEAEKINEQYSSFSKHDATHSMMIVSCIELMLGQERIYSLTPTDAWLILMCAYKHDMGMLVNPKELRELLSRTYKHDNAKLIKGWIQSPITDISNATYFIFEQLNEEDREKFYSTAEKESIMSLPAKIVSSLSILVRGEARSKHHTRMKAEILENIHEKTYDGLLTITLVELVAEICNTHMIDRENIMKLDRMVKGAGRDYAHPRFIAILLRLGDLLDMDSNRFSPYIYKYSGTVKEGTDSYEGIVHEIKHYSVRNICISPEAIGATAVFNIKSIKSAFKHRIQGDDDEHKEHQIERLANRAKTEINKWFFDYLKKDVEYFALKWHKIVPKNFPGSAPMIEKLCIRFEDNTDNTIEEKDSDFKFKISTFRASKVLEGVGMYDDFRVFLRELIQNAWDATKIYIWKEFVASSNIKEKDYKDYDAYLDKLRDEGKNVVAERAVDYPIHFNIKATTEKDDTISLEISVIDNGIGIDSETLKNMRHIGDARNSNHTEISKMPECIRPTSAFGIGLQAVFTVTDQFKIKSTSRSDLKQRIVILTSPKYD